jgi:drug/metabolite transporter (DMT)-like permease
MFTTSRKQSGVIYAVVANVIWGTTFVATQHVLTTWSPITATVIRFGLASILLALGMKYFSLPFRFPATKSGWIALLSTAVFGFGLLYPLQGIGLKSISSGASAILMLTAPLFLIAILATMGEAVPVNKWIGVILGIVGGAILIGARTSNSTLFIDPLGSIYTLGAAFCLSLSTLTAKKVLAEIDQLSLTLLAMTIGTIILLPGVLIEAPVKESPETTAWISIIYLALFCSILAFFLWNKSIATGSPSLVASTMHIKTPVAVALGIAINHEPISLSIFLGGVIVGCGVIIATYQRPKKGTDA